MDKENILTEIESLKQRKHKMEIEVLELEGQAETLYQQAEKTEEKVEELNELIDEIDNQIYELEDEYEDLDSQPTNIKLPKIHSVFKTSFKILLSVVYLFLLYQNVQEGESFFEILIETAIFITSMKFLIK